MAYRGGAETGIRYFFIVTLRDFLKTLSVRAEREKVETGKLTLIPKSFGSQKVCVQPVSEVRSEGRKRQEPQGSTSRLRVVTVSTTCQGFYLPFSVI